MSARELANAEQSDVCQLTGDPNLIERAAAAAGLTVIRIDLVRQELGCSERLPNRSFLAERPRLGDHLRKL
jgi:hypothetical protein